jgi:3-isopropylmalate/(R)-2-methylmalate dehydratase small subunit
VKRRGFLQLLGAALTAPLLPSQRLGAAAGVASRTAAYPALAYKLAMDQARSRVSFSVFSLAKQLGLRVDQTEALLADLSKQGVLGPLQGTTQAGRWARSRVWQRPSGSVVAAQTATSAPQTQIQDKAPRAQETPMDKFNTLTGIAAPMPLINIDTDMIIPKQFLKTIKRSGLGVNLFDEMRYDDDGKEIPEFVLNKPQYRDAEILVAGDNFGCGSSREHAPWAIKDFGIRCVIAPSYADIFYNNCFKNGILPIALPQEQVDVIMADAEKGANARVTIDLEAQTVTTSDGDVFSFEVDAFKKRCLMEGLDDIGLTMEKAASIDTYEAAATQARPWV